MNAHLYLYPTSSVNLVCGKEWRISNEDYTMIEKLNTSDVAGFLIALGGLLLFGLNIVESADFEIFMWGIQEALFGIPVIRLE
jgi:hypothetical protein